MYPHPFMPWAWRDLNLWHDDQEDHVLEAERDRRRTDLAGYRVEALDGHIGSVDRASYDTDDSWLVVDTGPWILGRKVLLPAGTVEHIDHVERKVYLDQGQELIKNSPSYDPDAFDSPDYRGRVARYYADSYGPAR